MLAFHVITIDTFKYIKMSDSKVMRLIIFQVSNPE